MTVEELQIQIQQKQAEIKELAASRNAVQYESLKPMIGKYYQNKHYTDNYFYVDAIGKDTLRPLGCEIEYKSIRQSVIDVPGQWVEISKEEFEKAFNAEINRLRKEMKI